MEDFMSTQVQMRRGTEAENDSFVGAEGEITIDTTNDTIRVHDGIKTGGYRVMKGNNPITGGTYTKITFDEKGLVTKGEQISSSDIYDLPEKYLKKKGNVVGGTFTKVIIDNDGLVSAGAALDASDVPALSISKTTGLQDALDSKGEKLAIVEKRDVSSLIPLVEGCVNVIKVKESATLEPPVVTDTSVLRQIMVQLDNTSGFTIGFSNVIKGFGDSPIPEITEAGHYNIYFEYNVIQAGWICGAIKA